MKSSYRDLTPEARDKTRKCSKSQVAVIARFIGPAGGQTAPPATAPGLAFPPSTAELTPSLTELTIASAPNATVAAEAVVECATAPGSASSTKVGDAGGDAGRDERIIVSLMLQVGERTHVSALVDLPRYGERDRPGVKAPATPRIDSVDAPIVGSSVVDLGGCQPCEGEDNGADDEERKDVYVARYANCYRGNTDVNRHAEEFLLEDRTLLEHLRQRTVLLPSSSDNEERARLLSPGGHRLVLYMTYQPCHHSGGRVPKEALSRLSYATSAPQHPTTCSEHLREYFLRELRPRGVALELVLAGELRLPASGRQKGREREGRADTSRAKLRWSDSQRRCVQGDVGGGFASVRGRAARLREQVRGGARGHAHAACRGQEIPSSPATQTASHRSPRLPSPSAPLGFPPPPLLTSVPAPHVFDAGRV